MNGILLESKMITAMAAIITANAFIINDSKLNELIGGWSSCAAAAADSRSDIWFCIISKFGRLCKSDDQPDSNMDWNDLGIVVVVVISGR